MPPLFLMLLLLSMPLHAAQKMIPFHGDEIPIDVYPALSGPRILWLSSEFGGSERRVQLAQRLAENGVEVWSTDLHAAWFLPVGRYSLNEVDPAAIAAVIDAALTADSRPLYLMAAGRSAALGLRAIRHWQSQSDDTKRLGGLLAVSPRLFVSTPQGGEAAEYLPIASASNTPIYLLQPEDSGGFWRIGQDVRELEKGGSPVFLHRLKSVSDGFHTRHEYSDEEAAMTDRLPDILRQAMTLLAEYGGTPNQAALMPDGTRAPEKPDGSDLLRPYPGERYAPTLSLPTLKGGPVDLARLKGRVVLVNFWATWCPPCVEEIPSLQRLYQAQHANGLDILAVDVGETVETMEAFLADKPINFPVLMDTEASALKRWGVYAFPTTLVLDRQHRIRYAVFGAFDWGSPEVMEKLQPLLDAN